MITDNMTDTTTSPNPIKSLLPRTTYRLKMSFRCTLSGVMIVLFISTENQVDLNCVLSVHPMGKKQQQMNSFGMNYLSWFLYFNAKKTELVNKKA